MDFEDQSYSNYTPSVETCIISRRFNQTIIPDIYAGIPVNFLFNLIGFVFLVLLFGLLRKKAWNYGRLALLHKSDNRWMELFFGDNEETAESAEASVSAQLSTYDRGFFSWIVTAFKVNDRELLRRAGPDGLLYVTFERHLIVLTFMMMVVALCVALPINYSGTMRRNSNETFSLTTLSNVDAKSNWMWVYTIIVMSYLPIGSYVMRRFTKQVRDARPSGELAARTLLISEIPKHQCNVNSLKEYFTEAFPTLTVEDVTLAHDIKRLSILEAQRDCAEQARLYCENHNKKKEPLKLYPHLCGQVVGCCCKKQVDALEFYTAEEIRLTALAEEEKKVALSKPLGIAFVTLGTPGAARTMRRQLRSAPAIKWEVNYAPAPSDIFWENLNIPTPFWYFNAVLINLILAIFLFFVTTPAVIMSALDQLDITPELQNLGSVISTFLPTLMLVSITALMPVLVGRSELLVRHWTRSGLNNAVMKKTLSLLLLMVLILPSLGLTSAQAVLERNIFGNTTIKWECIFLADQGALFVNYIITASLFGCGLELVRFPELAMYTIRLCIARSRAERVYVRKAVVWEFPLGAHYAWLLLVFTMTTVYSMACPLITPFALLYFLIKHMVDRHNLCFAYGPSSGGGKLASAAVSAAGAAPILAQAALLALGLVRKGLSPLAALQLSGLAASILGLVTGATLPASKPKPQIIKRDFSTGLNFIAPVLRKKYGSLITEEVTSVASNSQVTVLTDNSSTDTTLTENSASSAVQESPKLYQNYGKDARV
ncbi:transmembrane protein 63 [Cotesia typhae]|uniref:transmembrane protein 63 n=1 Tax=Cotesia typhae TaxID=2053667 RepID=UPI003D68B3F7